MADFTMKDLRKQAPTLCEMFDHDAFLAMLQERDLASTKVYLPPYIKAGWLVPLEVNNKSWFHRGHMMIMLLLRNNNHIDYFSGLPKDYDFEDIMSRRAFYSDLEAEGIKDDAIRIQQLFLWLWTDNENAFEPLNAVHTKALIDLLLNQLDPNSFYEQQSKEDSLKGTALLVKDLLTMMLEIGKIESVSKISLPNDRFIYDRNARLEECRHLLVPLDCPFLVSPRRDMPLNKRSEFMKTRNELLVEKSYDKLVDHYQSNIGLFETETDRLSALKACLGHIYADLIHDPEKATAAYQEAIKINPGNETSFHEVSKLLQAGQKWQELVELLTKFTDTLKESAKKSNLLIKTAQIQAFKLNHPKEALDLYERCMVDGHSGNDFDNLYKIVAGLLEDNASIQLRALAILTMHVTSYPQCDKIEAILNKYRNSTAATDKSMSRLVEAGLQSFKGDSPKAFEYLREAIKLDIRNPLIDGILARISSKIKNDKEFREIVNAVELDSLNTEDLSNVWLRIAQTLNRNNNRHNLAFEYAEKAVNTNHKNFDAIGLAYALANELGLKEKAFVYATIQSALIKEPLKRTQFKKIRTELKKSIEEDQDKCISAYELLLQYDIPNNEIEGDLRALALSLDSNKAISFLQSIESRCMNAGMSQLVLDLYDSILNKDMTQDIKKALLERYLNLQINAKGDIKLDRFVPSHANLFILSPSEKNYGLLKTHIKDEKALKQWTQIIKEALPNIDDNQRLVKLNYALADCYQMLNDSEKAAESLAELLKISPDNASAFKCSFSIFEKLERFMDCTELCKNFPMDKLSSQERSNYCFKSFAYALVNLGDVKKAEYFFNTILNDDQTLAIIVVDQLIDKPGMTDKETEKLINGLEQLEQTQSNLAAISLKLARAKLLAKLKRTDDAIKLLDAQTKAESVKFKLLDRAMDIVTLFKNTPNYDSLKKLWLPDKPSIMPTTSGQNQAIPKHIETKIAQKSTSGENQKVSRTQDNSEKLNLLVKECADNLDDENFQKNVIENALKTLSKSDATILCNKLGQLYESKQRLPEAESFYKRAFEYTYSLEWLEFCKRNRKFKRAIKLLDFKLKKASEDTKNAVRLEWVLVCEQMRDFNGAIKLIDDVISNKDSLEKEALIAVYKQKAAYLIALNQTADAIATLQLASAEADEKVRDEIDVDTCLLMRQVKAEGAPEFYQKLVDRGVSFPKMQLLSACFDIDNEKYEDAENKLSALIHNDDMTLHVLALEQQLLMQKKRGDDDSQLKESASELIKLVPEHPLAKSILG